MAAGEASFSAYKMELNHQTVYHFIGLGATYPKYDWFYKVNDKYESYADTLNLKPLRFKREAREGGNYTYDDYVFDLRKNKVFTSEKRNKKDVKFDSLKITKCTNDVLTAIYYTTDMYNNTIPYKVVLRDPWPGNISRQEMDWYEFSSRLMVAFKVWVSR